MSNITFDLSEYNAEIVKYIEAWVAYSPNILEGFINTPFQLLGKIEIFDGTIIIDYELPENIYNEFDGGMSNQYMFLKLRGYSAIKRSDFSSIGFGTILPPKAPTGLSGNLNTFYYDIGGDAIVELSWDTTFGGDDSDIEVWGKWGSGDWELISESSGLQLGWDKTNNIYSGFNHNIGQHPTGTYHYKVRAVNDSGESEFSEETSVDTFAPIDISNLTGELTWITGTHDYTIHLYWQNHDSYAQIEIERKVDSSEFTLLSTLTGSPSTYADHIGVPSATHTYYYRIRGVK